MKRPEEYKNQTKQIFDDFLERIYRMPSDLLPEMSYLPYDVCTGIEQVRWRNPFIELMVRGDLREMTNDLNQWRSLLRSWHAWLDVMDGYEEQQAREIQFEFVESIAFKCSFEPSATRDRFTFIAINAFHQALLAFDSKNQDKLAIDKKIKKGKHPSRHEKEEELISIFHKSKWKDEGDNLLKSIKELDGKEYRNITQDFRNLASHAIAPRFTVGHTNLVSRYFKQTTKLEPIGNGSFEEIYIPESLSLVYGYGGTPPMSMQKIIEANRAEFEKAVNCFNKYIQLIDIVILDLPTKLDKTEKTV
jgi:hypothetical protein